MKRYLSDRPFPAIRGHVLHAAGICFLSAAMIALGGYPTKIFAAGRLEETRILFVSDCPGHMDLYSMRPDGTGVRRLTTDPAGDREPDWSPDGTQIVFRSNRTNGTGNPEGDFELFLMRADGSDLRQLTRNDFDDRHPTFSPDGKAVYFVSTGGTDTYQLYALDLVTGDTRQLTRMGRDVKMPDCSPDGRWLLFQSEGEADDSHTQEIYRMRTDGTELVRLTSNRANDKVPQFSPDGTSIVFQTDRDGNYELYRMEMDGGRQTRLTHVAGKDKRISWSPDGRKIVFQSTRTGHWQIFTMNSDGSDQVQITFGDCDSNMPRWSAQPRTE